MQDEEHVEQQYDPPIYDYIPLNRFVLLIESEDEFDSLEGEEPVSAVLLPEGYKSKKNNHEVYYIESVSADCEKVKQGDIGRLAIVDASMVENVKISHGEYLIVQENYICGILSDCTG